MKAFLNNIARYTVLLSSPRMCVSVRVERHALHRNDPAQVRICARESVLLCMCVQRNDPAQVRICARESVLLCMCVCACAFCDTVHALQRTVQTQFQTGVCVCVCVCIYIYIYIYIYMSVECAFCDTVHVFAENRSNTIVNLGKGIYGLKEWVVEGGVVIDAGDSNDDSKVSIVYCVSVYISMCVCVCVCTYVCDGGWCCHGCW
jgi:hypothetical protein